MAYTSAGLPNNGLTAHYQISYDTALSTADGLDRATSLFSLCEQDFALMAGWFLGVSLIYNFPLPVQIANDGSGGRWDSPDGLEIALGTSPIITVGPGTGSSVNVIRYLLVSEVSEMFMASKNNGWSETTSLFQGGDEGSIGEGLSRFLGVQFQLANGLGEVPPSGFGVVRNWLNNTSRPDYVNNDPDDNQPDIVTGCTTLFIYYLYNQLGYSIQSIINAGGGSLAGVYSILTGQPDGWTPFIGLVDLHYPTAHIPYYPLGDNIFPVSNLTQFYAPNQVTCGYNSSTLLFVDRPTKAQVNIQLTSDDTSVVQVQSVVTVPVGVISVPLTIFTSELPIPFPTKSVNVHASYAGVTLTVAVEVVPPQVVSLTLAPSSVICGDSSIGTITLNEASLFGDVMVEMVCGAPGFAAVPALVTVPQGAPSAQFTITTPNYATAFKTAYASIYATYSGSSASATLTVKSRVIAPILNTFVVSPASVAVGGISRGTITLVEAAPIDAVISLEALDPAVGPNGPLPGPGNPSTFATVPASITIPAGQVSGTFIIKTHGTVAPGTQHVVRVAAGGAPLKYASLTLTV